MALVLGYHDVFDRGIRGRNRSRIDCYGTYIEDHRLNWRGISGRILGNVL